MWKMAAGGIILFLLAGAATLVPHVLLVRGLGLPAAWVVGIQFFLWGLLITWVIVMVEGIAAFPMTFATLFLGLVGMLVLTGWGVAFMSMIGPWVFGAVLGAVLALYHQYKLEQEKKVEK